MPVMGLSGSKGAQAAASHDELVGSSDATKPQSCWPRPPVKSVSGASIPFNAVNGTAKLTTDMKWVGSPGSTPQRFVGLTTNHGPAMNKLSVKNCVA